MTAYATDEDIALRASTDFAVLCPRDQVLASGSDGIFLAADPWTLTSSSVNFAGFGVAPGQIVKLAKPTAAFGANGELFAVDAAVAGAVTLRRKGQPSRVGQPPASSGGLLNVEFVVRTLGPQIGLASYDMARRLGIDEWVPGRRTVDLLDPLQLREATVLSVLAQQYLDQSRQFSGSSTAADDVYAAKARITKDELDDVLDRLVLRWRTFDVTGRSDATTRFSTRISR